MKLSDLEPQWLKYIGEQTWQHEHIFMNQAEVLQFLCPVCFVKNNGSLGTHSIWVPRKDVPKERISMMGRWAWSGTGFDNLTLDSSVQAKGGCNAHFNVINGQVIILP